jgi:Tfp pilus assembly protein PilF
VTAVSRLRWPDLVGIAGLALLGFAARGTYLLLGHRSGFFTGLFMDSRIYVDTAGRIAEGLGAGDHPYLLSPLYPYVLSRFFGSGGEFSTSGVQWLQVVFGSLTVGLTAWIGIRVGGRAVGIVAGLGAAVFGPLIFYDGAILVASLQSFFFTLALGLLVLGEGGTAVGLRGGGGFWCWLGAGFAFGISAALRPTGLAVAFLVLLVLWFGAWFSRGRSGVLRGAFRRSLALLFGMVVMIAPFTIRNVVHGGEAVLLSANSGLNFWVGNSARATGLPIPMEDYDLYGDPLGINLAARKLGPEVTYREASGWWRDRALRDIRDDPVRWLGLLATKAIYFGHPHEVAQMMQNFDSHKDLLWVLRFPLDARVVLLLALLSPLALWLEGRGDRLAGLRWPLVFVVGYAGVLTLFFMTSRFRIPVIPAAMVLGSVTVVSLWRLGTALFRERSTRVLGLTGTLLVLGAASYGIYGHASAPYRLQFHEAVKLWSLGHTFAEHGDLQKALQYFRQAVEADDHYAIHYDLAVTYGRLGRTDEARTEFLETLRQNPGHAQAWLNLAQIRQDRDGSLEGAREAYEKAVAADPGLSIAYFKLGEIYLRLNEPELALASLSRFLSVAPTRSPLRAEAQRKIGFAQLMLNRAE